MIFGFILQIIILVILTYLVLYRLIYLLVDLSAPIYTHTYLSTYLYYFLIPLHFSFYIFHHNQVALSHYCLRDYEKAQNIFEQARETDPHRIEHLDAYSNILYVREKRAELSFLAHRYFILNRFLLFLPVFPSLSLFSFTSSPLCPSHPLYILCKYHSLLCQHHFLYIYIYIDLFVTIYPSIFLSFYLRLYLSGCLSISIYLSMHLSIFVSVV